MPANRPCGFCKKPCTDPKFLPCFHAFCSSCLRFQIISVPTNRQWEGFSCPSCGTYTKAVDPDQPLASWADQFPDTPFKRKPMKKLGSSEDSVASESPQGRGRAYSLVDSELPSSLSSEPPTPFSPGRFSPISPGPVSPVSSGHLSPTPSEPMSPVSTTNNQSLMDVPSTPDKTVSISNSSDFMTNLPVSPGLSTQTQETVEQTHDSVTDSKDTQEHSEQQMCMIHPWKPILVSCRNCDSLACGQCLSENHPTCGGEDFFPISNMSVLPSMSQLEEEVHKVTPVSDMMSSSSYQLQQTRELIRQKIKQMALQMIQSMKKEEEQMVRKVQHLYHSEILRLKSGISPSEDLLKQVQQLANTADDLSKHQSAAILLQADELLNNQNILLGKLKAVDFDCVPPVIDFDRNYNTLGVSLGDLVADQGFYPKHDIPEVPVEVELQSLAVADVADVGTVTAVPAVPAMPDVPDAAAKSNAPKSSHSQVSQMSKSKTKSFMGKLLSPIQKTKSKFYVKVPPEL